MQAVILAAGQGNRMLPLTSSRPKAMLPVGNKPILEHIIIEAKDAGVDTFIVVAGHLKDQIQDYFREGNRWNAKISYVLQEHPRGTADALGTVEKLVGEKFLVLNGDILTSKRDIGSLIKFDRFAIGVKEITDPIGLGIIEETSGIVRRIHEKPEAPNSKLANTGVYFMTRQIFRAIHQTIESKRKERELTQAIEILIRDGIEVRSQLIQDWVAVSYPWDLFDANEFVLSRMNTASHGRIESNTHIEGAYHIGENTIVRSGSYIIGPVSVGDNCDIGPNCYIRPFTSIGNNCRIGAGVEIKNSIIMDGSRIPHLNYIGDSILGENCNLGAGTKIANLRLDEKEIEVNGINTHRRKFGAIFGDRVKTGINSSIDAGSVIENDSMVWPATLVKRKQAKKAD